MLVTMMLPTQVIMIPQYLIYYRLGLVPGYVPLNQNLRPRNRTRDRA